MALDNWGELAFCDFIMHCSELGYKFFDHKGFVSRMFQNCKGFGSNLRQFVEAVRLVFLNQHALETSRTTFC